MSANCQPIRPLVVAVAGEAGSGKSTLGRALAGALDVPMLDLDTMTNPLLDRIPEVALGGHWLASRHAREIRDGRYAVLRAVAAEVVRTTRGAVLVAPFTAELRGGAEWEALEGALPEADLHVVRIVGDPALFARRRAARGEPRDDHRPPAAAPEATVPGAGIEVILLDADLTPDQQLRRVLVDVGRRTEPGPGRLSGASFDAVLFDLDGTLADSTPSVNRSWRRLTDEYGVSPAALQQNHGQPAGALIGRLLPADRVAEGLARIGELEVTDAVTVVAARGAVSLWDGLPDTARAVVTSGTRVIAGARMAAAGLERPGVLVTADDVEHPKPDPEPFLTAARQLGVDPSRCLVVEDAPAGVRAGLAAGMSVLAVSGTSSAQELDGAHLVLDGLDRIGIRPGPAGLVLQRLE